jgi:hypothetical protein
MTKPVMGTVVAVVIALVAGRAEAGAKVDIEFTDPPLVDLLRLFADVGRTNIVLVDGTPAALGEVKYKKVAWDKVLDELVERAKLDHLKLAAGTIVVGSPEVVVALRKQKRTKYKGKKIEIDLRDADAAAAAKLLAVASGTSFAFDGAPPRRASLRLKKVPAGLAGDVLALQTGGTVASTAANAAIEKAAEPGACVATQSALSALELHGIATVGKTRYALFTDAAGGHVVGVGSCIGIGGSTIEEIGSGFVTLATTTEKLSYLLYPRALTIP